jgi:hypothetical protein
VQRLLVAEANLQVADPNLFDTPSNSNLEMDWSSCPQIGSGKDTVPVQMKAVRKASASVLEAYIDAATAAYPPSPPAQKEFLGSPDSVRKLKQASAMVCLDNGHKLSDENFGLLVMFLQKCNGSSVGTLDHQQEPEPTVVGKSEYNKVSRRELIFWDLHTRVSSMVNAALQKFNRTHVGFFYYSLLLTSVILVSFPAILPGVHFNPLLMVETDCRNPSINFMLSVVLMSLYLGQSFAAQFWRIILSNISIPISTFWRLWMLNLQSSSLLNVTLRIVMILGVSVWIGHAQLVVCSSLLSHHGSWFLFLLLRLVN